MPVSVCNTLEDNVEQAALQQASVLAPAPDSSPATTPNVSRSSSLLGIPDHVYDQINAALLAGKRHFIFYGPPGTGKTSLAIHVAEELHNEFTLVTGSAAWSSHDLIGGYQPTGTGGLSFVPGVLLENFDKPFIIDELNRCDIDKVIGPLFTVLSGQSTTLPFLSNVDDPMSDRIVIHPYAVAQSGPEYGPENQWRLLATMNTLDKGSLYQMSYALTRRFAWIFVDVPSDLEGFIEDYLQSSRAQSRPTGAPTTTLSLIWASVSSVRPFGAGPIIDMIHFCEKYDSTIDFYNYRPQDREAYVLAAEMYLFPMLDGITVEEANQVLTSLASSLNFQGTELEQQIRDKLLGYSL